ncbi:MAG: hypothetical protein JW846_08675 [Dehalococcoidia bacterium]|nr:hypothetical protein [Dehalococcoidia bacterium]
MEGLTRDEAVLLCSRVREQNQATVYSPERIQCWKCVRSSGGNPDAMLMTRSPGYLGCDLINKLLARMKRASSV